MSAKKHAPEKIYLGSLGLLLVVLLALAIVPAGTVRASRAPAEMLWMRGDLGESEEAAAAMSVELVTSPVAALAATLPESFPTQAERKTAALIAQLSGENEYASDVAKWQLVRMGAAAREPLERALGQPLKEDVRRKIAFVLSTGSDPTALETRQLEVRLSADKSSIVPGESLQLTTTIRNHTRRTVLLRVTAGLFARGSTFQVSAVNPVNASPLQVLGGKLPVVTYQNDSSCPGPATQDGGGHGDALWVSYRPGFFCGMTSESEYPRLAPGVVLTYRAKLTLHSPDKTRPVNGKYRGTLIKTPYYEFAGFGLMVLAVPEADEHVFRVRFQPDPKPSLLNVTEEQRDSGAFDGWGGLLESNEVRVRLTSQP